MPQLYLNKPYTIDIIYINNNTIGTAILTRDQTKSSHKILFHSFCCDDTVLVFVLPYLVFPLTLAVLYRASPLL